MYGDDDVRFDPGVIMKLTREKRVFSNIISFVVATA
jgi:hypothetical protein